ncbi:hypothetical protein [Erysipelothrix aquatica]|uniref:hypothetical protein n=1 Tax=Erysipelothrix aquatica TaxID=2683714 RepID=UPI00135B3583|nr:hypothetical protein [Erysipelothrix aquatica]
MSKPKIELNNSAIRDLLRGEDVQNALSSRANSIKSKLGEGYETDIYVGKNRANASIRAESKEAKRDNKKNNTLLKAMNL